MKTNSARPSHYDLVAYPSYTHPQTHPNRLGVVGALFGLETASAGECRVLELGCGNGSNLIPMAAGYLQSEFVGIDLAVQPIVYGQRMINDLGLRNVRLIQGNVTEISPDWGKFDYIIAHGLFSWVPANVRTEILRVCRDNLSHKGLAFISYNAFPGCHLRLMLREMMQFHVRDLEATSERVQQALALTKFLAESQASGDQYRLWLKDEWEGIAEHEEGHIYHDELAEFNTPFYFHQFVELASSHGLQYVGEADYFEMFDHGFTESARQGLAQIGHNRLLREQYLDFLKCRRFRQTLLCHREVSLKTEPQAEPVVNFLVSSLAKCAQEPANLATDVALTYKTPKGANCTTDYALGKAALSVLEKSQPVPLAFADLLRHANLVLHHAGIQTEPSTEAPVKLATFLLQLFGAGVVDFRTSLPPVAWAAGERPTASAIARWQAAQGDFVTSKFHIAVKLEDELGRLLLRMLDGTRDRNALREEIRRRLVTGDSPAPPPEEESVIVQNIQRDLERNLAKLARYGLLDG